MLPDANHFRSGPLAYEPSFSEHALPACWAALPEKTLAASGWILLPHLGDVD